MNKFACRYTIVRFMPYAETGEFANVGIVLVCPQTGYFGFKLQDRRYARITGFFGELEGRIYTEAIRGFGTELKRVQQALQGFDAASLRNAFEQLIHPREAVVRFSDSRALLVLDPAQSLQAQFARYVERDFVTTEYIEQKIENRLRALLKDIPLHTPFRAHRVGDDAYSAQFPFVQMEGGQPNRIIKPFNLAQPEVKQVYEHGDRWVQKLGRLQRRGTLPDEVLFAVKEPETAQCLQADACREISAALCDLGVQVVPAADEQRVMQFALGRPEYIPAHSSA